jgi:hypothetical protein
MIATAAENASAATARANGGRCLLVLKSCQRAPAQLAAGPGIGRNFDFRLRDQFLRACRRTQLSRARCNREVYPGIFSVPIGDR